MRRVLLTLAFCLIVLIPAFGLGGRKTDCSGSSSGDCSRPSAADLARLKAGKGGDSDRLANCPRPPKLEQSFRRWEAEKTLKVAGVGSCASASCHNAGGALGTKGSEYATWIAVDPHAKALRALDKPESKRMHEIMAEAFPAMRQYKGASTNPLCLKCHGMGADVDERFQGDGVGCERCHGPAEKWRTTHYLTDFDRNTPGFVDTRCDQAARAYTCMKCHVGDADQEVDHVLIAAGHPRLRFEYAAYYANYPRHWEPLGEKTVDPAFEAFTWGLGQLVTARAALELLVSRAADPAKERNWPEFAEFDCTACHHDLKRVSPRQERYVREANQGLIPRVRRAGDLPWGTWYYPLLPTLKLHIIGGPDGLEEAIAGLDHLMRLKEPPRESVRRQALRVMEMLDSWITELVNAKAAQQKGRPAFTEARMKQMIRDLANRNDIVLQGWDGGSQVYLGIAALNQAIGDSNKFYLDNQPLKEPLTDIRVGLKMSLEPKARTLYDTPNEYFTRLDAIFKGLNSLRRLD